MSESVALDNSIRKPFSSHAASLAFEGELFAAASLLRVSVQQFRVVLSSSSGTAAAAVLDSVPQSGRILSNGEPVVLDLSASGRRLAHSTGSAPTTGLAAASTWRLTCPLASAALFGPRPAAPVGPRPPRLPCASRSVALLHLPLSGSSTPGRRAGSAWAPALGSHCELRGHGCLRAECVRLPDGVCVWS